MYKIESDSPLNLHLDEQNPRFRISVNPSQNDIRNYMLLNEDGLRLASKMVEMNTMLPGERIIIFNDGAKKIVLEGNRRTCIYQMLLNRDLIPEAYAKTFPVASKEFLEEISSVPIDVVETREEAMAFLAARHIEGIKTWSSVSKWRISYEYYTRGKNINEIANYLVLTVSTIKTNICNYKILLRGLENNRWTTKEKELLSPLDIKPDKLIRILRLSSTNSKLGLYFDENFTLKSSFIQDKDLDEIIYILTKKAFIDNEINTRSTIEDIYDDIKKYIDNNSNSHKSNNTEKGETTCNSTNTNENDKQEPTNEECNNQANNSNDSNAKNNSNEKSSGGSKKGNAQEKQNSNESQENKGNTSSGEENIRGNGNVKNLPYFFTGLQYAQLSPNDPLTHGISRICNEIDKFSNKRLVSEYPLAAAFLTRSLIEHSLIYYSKTHNIQGQSKLIWDQVSAGEKNPKLSSIIKKYSKSLTNYITDSNMQNYFTSLFEDYDKTANPLNWVVHRPEEYVIPDSELIQLPRKGLLVLINYLIS